MITFCKMTLDVTRNYMEMHGGPQIIFVLRKAPLRRTAPEPPPPLILYSFLLGMLGVLHSFGYVHQQ